MKRISPADVKNLISLLSPAIDFTQFEHKDLVELQSFVEVHDIDKDVRKALKLKINNARRTQLNRGPRTVNYETPVVLED